MFQITRHIERKIDERMVKYPFTTYDIIFLKPNESKPNWCALTDYLKRMFTMPIPMHGDMPSATRELVVDVAEEFTDKSFCQMVQDSQATGLGSNQHPTLQKYAMEMNPKIIGIEVPVYDEKWLGFMDLLEYDRATDKIKIIDYKPNASRDRKAPAQTLRYKALFCKCAQVSPKDVEAFYGDDQNFYKII